MKTRRLTPVILLLVCVLWVGVRPSFSQGSADGGKATTTRTERVIARWRVLAEITLQTERPDEAINYYVRIAELSGNNRDIERAALTCLRYKDFKKALPLCERLVPKIPDQPLVYYRLAICHEGLGDNAARDKALESAVKCTESASGFSGAVNGLSYTQYEGMLRRAAENFWAASAKRTPDTDVEWFVLMQITDLLIEHGEYGQAVKICKQRLSVLRLMEQTNGYRNIERRLKRCEALLVFSQGKFEQAAAGLREIIEDGEDSYDAPAELYRCLVKLGRNDEAEKVMLTKIGGALESIGENPEDYENRNSVAWFYALCRNRNDEATKLAREAVKGRPNNSAYLDTLAELLYQKGEYKEAFRYAGKALGVHPGRHIYLWRQYEKMKAAAEKKKGGN
jgi:tetratricopeptide (TPR) repeat protein